MSEIGSCVLGKRRRLSPLAEGGRILTPLASYRFDTHRVMIDERATEMGRVAERADPNESEAKVLSRAPHDICSDGNRQQRDGQMHE